MDTSESALLSLRKNAEAAVVAIEANLEIIKTYLKFEATQGQAASSDDEDEPMPLKKSVLDEKHKDSDYFKIFIPKPLKKKWFNEKDMEKAIAYLNAMQVSASVKNKEAFYYFHGLLNELNEHFYEGGEYNPEIHVEDDEDSDEDDEDDEEGSR